MASLPGAIMVCMLRLVCQAVLLLALALPVLGQVSEASLRALYGKPVNGSYAVRPGVTMKTMDGPKDQACVLTIVGAATDDQLLDIFDEMVPASVRGLALESMLTCMGVCQSNRKYEKLTAVFYQFAPAQIGSPAGIVSFTTKACSRLGTEALANGFKLAETSVKVRRR